MGIEMHAVPVEPGQTAVFNFQNQVQAYILGIWAFNLNYGTNVDHWVQTASIKMLPSQEGQAVVGNQVSVIVDATLTDGHSGVISPSTSILYPVCLAITGTGDPNTMLANYAGIADGMSLSVPMPGQYGGFTLAASCISGFDLSFADNNQILGMSAGCGFSYDQSQGEILASASMFDSAGHTAQLATVDAGYMASTDTFPGFQVIEVTAQTQSAVQVTMDQLTSISQVVCMIRSWGVQNSSPRNVKQLQVGSWGPPQTNGNVVTLPNLSAQIWDNSNPPHFEDDAISSATILIIAIP